MPRVGFEPTTPFFEQPKAVYDLPVLVFDIGYAVA
jgi:hypothetical protein